MNKLVIGLATGLLLFGLGPRTQASDAAGDDAATKGALTEQQLWQKMERKQGEVTLLDGLATLKIPKKYFYIKPDDAKRVLEEFWGNPPGAPNLGMIFPAGSSPFEPDSWALTVQYDNGGHVADDEAEKIDFSELLKDMQADTQAGNRQRLAQGYQSVELVGWATKPFYDSDSKKLHWAKELRFAGDDNSVLNYNIRVLGREGYLLLNFVADINQLKVVNRHLDNVLAMAEFSEGNRYQDYDPASDKLAAYGIGALVAGKVLSQSVLLKALLLLKKFWYLPLLLLGALAGLWHRATYQRR